jgi:hypothetical protein
LSRLPCFAAAALFGLLLFFAPCLVVRDGAGEVRAVFALTGGRGFAVSYLHSVTHEPATEFFRRGPGDRILLVSTEFGGSGAGLPFTDEGGSATIRRGKVVIEGMRRSFRSVRYAPLPLTRHRLRVAGRESDLLGWTGGTGQVLLSIERGGPAVTAAAAAAVARRFR